MEDPEREPLRVDELYDHQGQQHMNVVIWTRDKKGVQVDLEEDGHDAMASDMFDVIHDSLKLSPEYERDALRKVFSMWMVSPLLTLPMKEHHKPYHLAQMWDDLCYEYVDCTEDETARDEPVIMFQRNVFLTQCDEDKLVTDTKLWELLYCEANQNVVDGHYVVSDEDYHSLAGIQVCIDLGNYSDSSLEDYKKDVDKFYPKHIRKQQTSIVKSKQQRVAVLAQQLKDAHKKQHMSGVDKLYRDYIGICRTYPFYGASFFDATLAKPTTKLHAVTKYVFGEAETEVTVAINMEGVCIIDDQKKDVILAVPYSELSWELQTPKSGQDSRCLFLQFVSKEENGKPKHTEVLHVFSKQDLSLNFSQYFCRKTFQKWQPKTLGQARLMDALIDACVKRIQLIQHSASNEARDNSSLFAKCQNKTDRMCLTSYSMEGDPLPHRRK